MKLTNEVLDAKSCEAIRLNHVHFFIENPIQEYILDIEVVDGPPTIFGKAIHNPNNFDPILLQEQRFWNNQTLFVAGTPL
jgi:hypothetical protein